METTILKLLEKMLFLIPLVTIKLSVNEEYIQQKDIYTTSQLEDSNVADGELVTITLNNTTSITVTASTSGTT